VVGIIIGLLAVILNKVFCGILFDTETKLAAQGKIPARGKILYLKDYNFFKWGDFWFLSAMDFAIAYVLVERWPLPAWIAVSCFLAGVFWTALWHWIYMLPSHNPDSAYPQTGVVSRVGRIHLVYFAAQYILGFIGIGMVVLMAMGERQWSPAAFVGLAAGLGYFAMLFSDFLAGRFKRVRNPPG